MFFYGVIESAVLTFPSFPCAMPGHFHKTICNFSASHHPSAKTKFMARLNTTSIRLPGCSFVTIVTSRVSSPLSNSHSLQSGGLAGGPMRLTTRARARKTNVFVTKRNDNGLKSSSAVRHHCELGANCSEPCCWQRYVEAGDHEAT